jgi:endogenous inhibitor of DNA gyrase (YacG/DUF329 family)
MAQIDNPVYKKCVNCGRHSPEARMIMGQFCSEDCAGQYRRCPHCGDYFILDEDKEQKFCSSDCQNNDKIYIPGDHK